MFNELMKRVERAKKAVMPREAFICKHKGTY